MITDVQTPNEYERQQRLFEAKARGNAETEAGRLYRKAIELRNDILCVINENVLSLSDHDLRELENLADNIDESISLETMEDLEKGD